MRSRRTSVSTERSANGIKKRNYPAFGVNNKSKEVCRNFLRGKCTSRRCKYKHPGICAAFHTSASGCKHGDKCHFAHRKIDVKRRRSTPKRRNHSKGGKPRSGKSKRARTPGRGRRRNGVQFAYIPEDTCFAEDLKYLSGLGEASIRGADTESGGETMTYSFPVMKMQSSVSLSASRQL